MPDRLPLVGRDTDLKILTAAVTRADRRCILITGPAGIGKTRLAQEAVALLAPRMTVRWAHAQSADVPLGVFSSWVNPGADDPLEQVSGLLGLFDRGLVDRALCDRAPGGQAPVGRATAPSLLVIDDVQHADDLSLFLIHQLAVGTAVAIILIARQGDPVPVAVAELLASVPATRLELPALSADDVRRLLATVPGAAATPADARSLWQRSGGNPLCLTALISAGEHGRRGPGDGDGQHGDGQGGTGQHGGGQRGGGERGGGGPAEVELTADLAGTVESLVTLRDSADQQLLVDLLAEAGTLPLALLSRLTGAQTVERAEQDRLIEVSAQGDQQVRLAHPLYGEVRRAGLGDESRLALRVAILDAADDPADSAEPTRTLQLALLAVDTPGAAARDHLLICGAEAALGVLDTRLAATLCAAVGPGPERLRAGIVTGYGLAAAGDREGAEAAFSATERLDTERAHYETLAVIRANTALWAGDDLSAMRRLATDPRVTPATRAIAASVTESMTGNALAALRAAPADPPRIPGARVDGDAVNGLMAAAATIVSAGETGDPQRLIPAVDAGHTQLACTPLAASQRPMLGTSMVFAFVTTGALGRAELTVDRLQRHLTALPGISQAWLPGLRGTVALATGRIREAQQLSEAAVSGFDAIGMPSFIWYPFALVHAEASILAGDTTRARRLLARLRAHPHCGFEHLRARVVLLEGWLAWATGNGGKALRLVQAAGGLARDRGQHGLELYVLQAALRMGFTDVAGRAVDAAEAGPPSPRATLTAAHGRAFAAGDAAGRARLLRAVAGQYLDAGDEGAAAETTAQAAAGEAAAGDRVQAAKTMQQAQQAAEQLGLRTPTLTPRAGDGLTRRQRTIVALAAQGLSNRQIADELSVSVRTVEGHLYRAGRVLGAPVRK